MHDEGIGATHVEANSRVVVGRYCRRSFPRTSGATNYHEYKKFDPSGSSEREPSRCHANLKEHRNYYYCDKWWEFLHHD